MGNDIENWLRCNKCYRLMKKTTRIFSLTQCQHIFCNACVVQVDKQCPECKSTSPKTVSLVKPFPQPLVHYFGNVETLVQQCMEASRFQRIQAVVALRRFADIQGRYEDMKRTYYESMKRAKAMEIAYNQLQEQKSKITAEISVLRSIESQRIGKLSTGNGNFPREPTNYCVHSSGYAGSARQDPSRLPVWRNEIDPSSINSSFSEHGTRRHLQQVLQHVPQSASLNRPQPLNSGYRYSYVKPSSAMEYTPRVVFSRQLSPNEMPYQPAPMPPGMDWMSNRIPGSLGDSSNISSSDGTLKESPMVDNYYHSNFRRS